MTVLLRCLPSLLVLLEQSINVASLTWEALSSTADNTGQSEPIPTPTHKGWYPVPLDHFGDNGLQPANFSLKVLRYSTFKRCGGPIFFYAGNEGPIESFYENTGLPFSWAKEFGADVVFLEHRYYGSSLPFGSDTYNGTSGNLKFLRVEQALADYALFMRDYNQVCTQTGKKSKVISFGGSYGGILAAFLRMRYPTLFHMAIAASAPIPEAVAMQVAPSSFYKAITDNARDADKGCPGAVQQAFTKLQKLFQGGKQDDLDFVQKKFNLCKPLKSEEWSHFMQYARNAWTEMAMCDYPYPSSFLAPLPAWPVKAACKAVMSASEDEDYVDGLAKAVAMPYASPGSASCLDMYELFISCADQTGCGKGNDATAWDYQMCADMNIIVSSNNHTDMFPARKWALDDLASYCSKTYKVLPRPQDMQSRFGVLDYLPASSSAVDGDVIGAAYSNIVFSNGLLDPWHPGGYLEDLSETVKAILIPLGAHHLDLRAANKDDPECVIKARLQEKALMQKWLKLEPVNRGQKSGEFVV
eukprot:CAMPEP_0172681306 /NCGR_PEP_ID=MMETSP1074-20121228/17351_1 /TAXON_ID=2916 /ORGANISM="Ceratium fusus, Strain PA161109" /LENGTH=527 /DNA_ID=CAMNT_0013499779 /DNA_START=140 /DNA_END=1723 /DNA_ORIENTATION=+